MSNYSFVVNPAKSIEAVRALGQTALGNAQELAQINYQVAQELVSTAQAKAAQLLKSQDPKAALELLQGESVQEAIAQIKEYQDKVAQVLRHGNEELVDAIDALIDQSQDDLKEFVAAATSKAPAGSEAFVAAFTTAFNAAIQHFDQVRSTAQAVFANFEKSAETGFNSAQGQLSQVVKAHKAAAKKASVK